MDITNLNTFLLHANAAGYASGKEKAWTKEPDGSTTIAYEEGSWKSHDNFFGGEPYGGRMVVFHEKKPFWIMVYYGRVMEKADPDTVYKILRNALKRMPQDHPYRGPKRYREGEIGYTNTWTGTLEDFSGKETISNGKKLIYQSSYMGGLVDQRKGV
ncbi:hypothetical protein HY087_00860 [Candidatus Gottesmanbacteria bacterium]|nr:hypothetical protein [Candidatus Gottesmanbacteria bacterium]